MSVQKEWVQTESKEKYRIRQAETESNNGKTFGQQSRKGKAEKMQIGNKLRANALSMVSGIGGSWEVWTVLLHRL